ncbi:MAG: hypothetical protein GTO54_01750, partial [Nitrososphaeria archaeon]|nr:hypothetical protein [Nitrososphaeria archaeon]
MARRSKLEIYMSILEGAQLGLKPTRIAYRANVSYRQFQQSIDFLIEKKLLRIEGHNEKSYVTTDKGKDLLESWYVVLEILNGSPSLRDENIALNPGDRGRLPEYEALLA